MGNEDYAKLVKDFSTDSISGMSRVLEKFETLKMKWDGRAPMDSCLSFRLPLHLKQIGNDGVIAVPRLVIAISKRQN